MDHLVIHYRVGDFVHLGSCPSVDDVAREAAALQPAVVELLDGGATTDSSTAENSTHPRNFGAPTLFETTNRAYIKARAQAAMRSREASAATVSRLRSALKAALPNARHVSGLSPPGASHVSTDRDFYRMVHAPLLLTAGGSYAIAAAIASYAREVRTPAARDLLHLTKGQSRPESIGTAWRTYAFKVQC